MAGEARSESFMLGTATVMVGPMADLMNLNTAHSVGLVKNITMKTTPAFTDLTQGVKNTLVYSVMTANDVAVTGEMYEYTGQNLTYAAGLNGSAIKASSVTTTVATAIAAPIAPASTVATVSVKVGDGSKFAAGQNVLVQVGSNDQVFPRKILSIAVDVLTLDSGFPVGIPLGSTVTFVNMVAIGSQADQPYLAAKIVGTMANGDEIVILLPKIRFASGISVAFKTDNYDFMPLEMKVFDLVSTDPFYTPFQTVGPEGAPAKAALYTPQ